MGLFLHWWLKTSGYDSKLEEEYTIYDSSSDAGEIIPRRARKWSTTATVGRPRSQSPNPSTVSNSDSKPTQRLPSFLSSASSNLGRKKRRSNNTSTEAIVQFEQPLRNSRNFNVASDSTRVSKLIRQHKLALVIPAPIALATSIDSPVSSVNSAGSEKADLLLGEEIVLNSL